MLEMTKNINYWILIVWIILELNLIEQVISAEPPDLTFVVKNDSRDAYCIIEGNALNSAIAWIFPIDNYTKGNLPTITSNYLPDIKNDYNCQFSKAKTCNNLWQMKNWQYSKFSSHNFVPTVDTRWEDFSEFITSNQSKDFNTRIEIPNTFHLGLSLRAAKNAEVFLCEGWDPHSFPCYYLNIGGADNRQSFLRIYKSIPDKLSKNDTKVAKYKSDSNVLSEFEWKNFELSLDANGTLTLLDTFKNITFFEFHDDNKKMLKPIYLFLRSQSDKALWKIHKNEYIFTNKSMTTQLGPPFVPYGTDICISLYVSMCRECKMVFFMLNEGKKKILKQFASPNPTGWFEIKLVEHNILEDKIKLYIETKYVDDKLHSGFWAIDDVRICAANEIRMTRLVPQISTKDMSRVTCEALSFPTWRPMQLTVSSSSAAETLRKRSPAQFIARVCTEDCDFPPADGTGTGDKVTVKKGVQIFIPIASLHNDPDYYPDTDQFNPDRFKEEAVNARPKYSFIGFGDGPRICIGRRFGMLQIKMGLVAILNKFELRVNKNTVLPIELSNIHIFSSPKNDILLDFYPLTSEI